MPVLERMLNNLHCNKLRYQRKIKRGGKSKGASQPIIRIEQLGTWDGSLKHYAPQIVGCSDFGGICIMEQILDTTNIIFITGNNDMGLTTRAGVVKFSTNETERMRIDDTGNVTIATPGCLWGILFFW